MTQPHYLQDILILLAAAIVVVPLFQRLRLGSVLGYLAAGGLVGPWGLGFIQEIEEIRHIAEFGVVFLLFIIGIELRPARLWALRRWVFGLGTAQLLVTGGLLAGLCLALDLGAKTAVIIGFGLALSSTAFGLQLLSERGELGSVYGRTAFSILLLQDLAVVPLLALVSVLSADTTLLTGIEYAVLEALVVIVGVILAGRYLLSPILRLVATSRTAEIFIAAAVFAVLGTAWLMHEVGLSLAMGAFLAGVMMADSPYRHQIIANIDPFRGILLGLFFMGVGMAIDFGLLGRQGLAIVGLVLALLSIKAAVVWALSRLMRVEAADAVRTAFLLPQSGEFGFVLFGLAAVNGLLSAELFGALTLVIALSMAATPLTDKLGAVMSRRLRRAASAQDVSLEHLDGDQAHVIIAGFGRVGRRMARILRAADVPYVAIESDPERVAQGRRQGFDVFYGDASQADVLKAAGAGRARVLVCTLDQPVASVRLVSILRAEYPEIAIHARGRTREHCDQLLAAGATVAVSETLEATLQIGSAVLDTVGIDDVRAANLIESFRNDYYA